MRKSFIVLILSFIMPILHNAYAESPKAEIGDWVFGVGGDNRFRYEFVSDYGLNHAADDSKSVIFNRLRIDMTASYAKVLDIFVEGLDAREWVYKTVKAGQADEFDLHQAYVDFKNILDSGVGVKAGRQKLSFGKNRVLGAPSWSNKINSFDALLLSWKNDKNRTSLFAANRVLYDQHNFNDGQGHEVLGGFYNTCNINKDSLIDTYFISQVDKDTSVKGEDNRYGHLERYTAGGRLNIKDLQGLEFDFEPVYQFGKNGTSAISAYAFAFYVQKQFKVKYNPKLRLEFNLASGDNDLKDGDYHTFIPVYQSTHEPYGIIDFFRWQNLREIAIFSSLEINKKFTLGPEFHAYWLDQDADAWYKSDGTKLWSNTTGNTGSFVGTELSLVGKYKISSNVGIEAGYSRFLSGTVAAKSGDEDGVNFVYLQTVLSF